MSDIEITTPSLSGILSSEQEMSGTLSRTDQELSGTLKKTYAVVIDDYNYLNNKPQIEGVTLEGDKTFEELNLDRITNSEMEDILT